MKEYDIVKTGKIKFISNLKNYHIIFFQSEKLSYKIFQIAIVCISGTLVSWNFSFIDTERSVFSTASINYATAVYVNRVSKLRTIGFLETFHKEITKIMLIYNDEISIIITVKNCMDILNASNRKHGSRDFGQRNHDINLERILQENGQ